MRSLSFVVVSGLAILLPASAAAQEVVAKAGLSLSTLSISADQFTHTSDVRPGIVAGAAFVQPFGPDGRVGLQVEGLFNPRGGNNVLRTDDRLKLTYVDVPVLARVRLWESGDRRLHLLAGPQFGFNLAATYEDEGESEDVAEDIEDVEASLSFGAAFEVGRLVVDGRYVVGLSGVFTEGDTGEDFRGRSFVATIGFRFGR